MIHVVGFSLDGRSHFHGWWYTVGSHRLYSNEDLLEHRQEHEARMDHFIRQAERTHLGQGDRRGRRPIWNLVRA